MDGLNLVEFASKSDWLLTIFVTFSPTNLVGEKHLVDFFWMKKTCNEEKFYFCGRKPEGDFPYCKLHVLYAFQPKNQKDDDLGDEIPEFIEKKVKASSG